jgi:Peptidase family M1 domain
MSALRRILEAQTAVSKVPKVMLRVGRLVTLTVVLVCLTSHVCGQAADSAQAPAPAESLYLKLRSVGLDQTRVYKIREASLQRAALHISLDDGTIAFTEDAGGHITGAFFKGDGELLLFPPNTTERASLALFTGAAILEEKFSTAYFRFNDNVFGELQPALRTADEMAPFAAEWNMTAHNLAQADALRLLISFSRDLPPADKPAANDHMLHAYLQGNKLGAFDVRYDSLLAEQIAAGQHKTVAGEDFYNVWVSFSVAARLGGATTERDADADPIPDVGISQFKIQAAIKPPAELDASAVLSVTAHHDGGRMLLFELSRLLQIKGVRADGHPVEFIHNQAIEGSQLARRGNDALAVFLPAPLHAGQKVELSFDYSGSVLSEAANGLLFVGEHGTWYPNVGLAMALFDLRFRYPVGWTLVATGRRTETSTTGAEQSSRWVSERPVPVAGFNLGKYSQTTTHAGRVDVVTYATGTVERGFAGTTTAETKIPDLFKLPGSARPLGGTIVRETPSPAENAQMVGAVSAKAVEFYERCFGPFPYDQLALTQFPGTTSQGWPGLIFLSSYAFLRPQQRERMESDPTQRLLSEQIIAHETAHQWWGDLVTWRGYRDQWIMEALANYSAMMLLESRNPAQFRQIMQKYRDDLLAKNRDGMPLMDAGPVTLGLRLSSSQSPNAYNAISYGRGTWLFHMLRTMMRDAERKGGTVRSRRVEDEPFVRALRRLRTEYEGRAVNTAQVMEVLGFELPSSLWYEGHKSLDWFDESWVNGSAVPTLELRGVKFSAKAGATVITGTIVQEHAPDSLVTAVPLYASLAGKSVFLGHVFAEGKETVFHLSAPAGVRKVLLDPEQTLLARGK